ncbi:hypothetical protein Pmani_034751 [Petrolisthes manimaculis]|uniref:LRRCT domain-containing protein n=1 Tax=Petrolisthes manimaculis TaxID=1843537 RepID=A0AAE1TPD2_9EUCA|nr:hypothetical protein Pmani_034751 [Petrolisthes manimaculis]
MPSLLRPSLLPLLLLLLLFLLSSICVPVRGYGDEGELCGLNGCQAIDLAKRHTDLTMAKMMHTIKPEALEEVFQNMAKLEMLVREVQDLQRDTKSLFQPGPVFLYPGDPFVSCWRLELLDHVPRKQQIPGDTRSLDLSMNRLKFLHKDSFHRLNELVELRALLRTPSKNFTSFTCSPGLQRYTETDEDIFFDLESLEDLDLSYNKVKINSIPTGAFRDLANLTFLELTGNRITQISFKDFLPLTKLRSLFLGQNLIVEIKNKTFVGTPHLEKLYLFSNKIVNIELAAFSGLNNLSWLLLNNNLLKRLPSTIFRRTPRLLRLQIDSNKFMRLPEGLLDELKIVEQVKLSMNPWHCDCFILYLTGWLHRNPEKIWDRQPKCRGPGDLGGKPVLQMTFNSVCDGQWASMTKIQGRV